MPYQWTLRTRTLRKTTWDRATRDRTTPLSGTRRRVARQGAGYGYQAPPSKTLSLISMVLGIVSVATLGSTFFTQIAAVVLGHIALSKEPAGRGMALAGLIMGYVTIGLGILLVILGIIFFAAWAPHISSTYSGAGVSV